MKIGGKSVEIGELISDSSVDGVVFLTKNRKVLKVIPIWGDNSDIRGFEQEVEIGKKMKSKYGAKVIASQITSKGSNLYEEVLKATSVLTKKLKIKSKFGLILMEHLEGKHEVAISLWSYLWHFKKHKQACPGKGHKIYQKLRETLKNFYKIGYYHGDLHFGNIYVILKYEHELIRYLGLKQMMEAEIKYVKIIDFGRSRKLKNNLSKKDCLYEMLKSIHNEFMSNGNLITSGRYHQRSLMKNNNYMGYSIKNNMSALMAENTKTYKNRPHNFRLNYLMEEPASYHRKKN